MPITLVFHELGKELKSEIILFHEYIYLRTNGSALIMQSGIIELTSAQPSDLFLREIFLAYPCKIENLYDLSEDLCDDRNRYCYTGLNPNASVEIPQKFKFLLDKNYLIIDSIDLFFKKGCVEIKQDLKREEIVKITFREPIKLSKEKYMTRRAFKLLFNVRASKPLRWWTGKTDFNFYINSLQSVEYEIYSRNAIIPIKLWYTQIMAPPKMHMSPHIRPHLTKNSVNPIQFDFWIKNYLTEKEKSIISKTTLPKEDNRYALQQIYYSNINPPFEGYTLPDQRFPSTCIGVTLKYPDFIRLFHITAWIFSLLALLMAIPPFIDFIFRLIKK